MGKLKRDTLQEQAVMALLGMIKEGYFADNRLPAEEELAQMLGISRGTLREALHVLDKACIITKKQGKGTYFHRDIALLGGRLDLTIDFIEILEGQGGVARLETSRPAKTAPSAEAKVKLRLKPEEEVWSFDWLYFKNESPAILAEIEIPHRYFSAADWQPGPWRTLTEYYRRHCVGELVKMAIWMKSRSYDRAAGIFQVDAATPLTWWEEVWYTLEDNPACYVGVYFKPCLVELALVTSPP
ncbi:Bacterial regulatory protein, gntR family [Neomoorella glycerini]|uniref:Bacterial regulatory protein, gntR family n=1 Tax=Neomoorella glycerini TaxID=55779 RepID=A0A6I5ZVV4_9FIRM|nr:GntR family transcriptional regulator [Moorella glycerini]QGP93789.1 Bacterial regulatory protein, gntR family [Moorella glycerini]